MEQRRKRNGGITGNTRGGNINQSIINISVRMFSMWYDFSCSFNVWTPIKTQSLPEGLNDICIILFSGLSCDDLTILSSLTGYLCVCKQDSALVGFDLIISTSYVS